MKEPRNTLRVITRNTDVSSVMATHQDDRTQYSLEEIWSSLSASLSNKPSI